MSDLRKLAAWNTAQAETLEAMSDDLNVDVEVLNHRQNAAIATLLDRVRSECRVDVLSTEVMSEGEVIAITITGVDKRGILRQLAERLKQG